MIPPAVARIETDFPVAWVILNRAEEGNPVDEALASALVSAWTSLASDEQVRAIGVRANGPAFSVGTPEGSATPKLAFGPKSCRCTKSVLVEVAGDVGAAAFGLLAEADVIVAADDVQFTVPLDPGDRLDVLQLLGRVPEAELRRLALLGPFAPLTAIRAAELGFVDEIVPRAALRRRAGELLGALALRSEKLP